MAVPVRSKHHALRAMMRSAELKMIEEPRARWRCKD